MSSPSGFLARSLSLSLAAIACAALLPACKATDARQGAGRSAAARGTAAPATTGAGAPTAGANGGRAGMSAAATRALDSGNVLLRAKKDREALAQYRIAAAEAPEHSAPWFGIGMAAKRLGDSALVDSAKQVITARSPNPAMQSLGATVPGHGAPVSPHGGSASAAPASPHGALPPSAPKSETPK